MCDNEYLAQAMVKERLRDAEARGAFNSMLRHAASSARLPRRASADTRRRPTRLELWWQASAAWVAHLALPKTWNRL